MALVRNISPAAQPVSNRTMLQQFIAGGGDPTASAPGPKVGEKLTNFGGSYRWNGMGWVNDKTGAVKNSTQVGWSPSAPAAPTMGGAPAQKSQQQGSPMQAGGTTGISTKPQPPAGTIPPMTPVQPKPLQTATRGGRGSGKPYVPPVPPGGQRGSAPMDRSPFEQFDPRTTNVPPPGGDLEYRGYDPRINQPLPQLPGGQRGGSNPDAGMNYPGGSKGFYEPGGAGYRPPEDGQERGFDPRINQNLPQLPGGGYPPMWNQGIAGPMDFGGGGMGRQAPQPQSGFSAWQVNQRANEYAQPLNPYMDQMDRQLKDRLRGTFGAGRGQISGAVNRQAMDTIENDAMNRRQLAADFLNRNIDRSREDIGNIWGTENQLGFNAWNTMANLDAQREAQQNQLGFGRWQTEAGIGADRERQQNQLGFNQWAAQFQDAAQRQQGLENRQWQSGESALDRGQQTNLFNAQQANAQAQANQANRNAIMQGIFGPLLGGLSTKYLNPEGAKRNLDFGNWTDEQIRKYLFNGGNGNI